MVHVQLITKIIVNHFNFSSYVDKHLLHHIIAVRNLTMVNSSWAHSTHASIETNLLFISITVKTIISISDWNSRTIRIVKFTKSIRNGTTAFNFVSFAEQSFIIFANLVDTDKAVIFVDLAFEFKVYTYNIIKRKFNVGGTEFRIIYINLSLLIIMIL